METYTWSCAPKWQLALLQLIAFLRLGHNYKIKMNTNLLSFIHHHLTSKSHSPNCCCWHLLTNVPKPNPPREQKNKWSRKSSATWNTYYTDQSNQFKAVKHGLCFPKYLKFVSTWGKWNWYPNTRNRPWNRQFRWNISISAHEMMRAVRLYEGLGVQMLGS